jgi:hypothetical protein
MPTRADSRPTNAKIQRAKAHLCELEDRVKSFLALGPYEIARRVDSETHETIFYAARVEEVPLEIAIIAADVLRNLRTALDQLACALVIAAGNYPTRNTGFPIFASLGVYRDKAREKAQGMEQSTVDLIDALKPYKGGNDVLWRLDVLSKIDKRHPIEIRGVTHRFQTVTPNVMEYLRKTWAGRPGAWPSPEVAPESLIEYERRHFPINNGDVIFVDPPGSNEQRTFTFDLAIFEQTTGAGRLCLTATLHEMVSAVEATAHELESCLT